MIYMDFRYFIHELRNLKENYTFTNKTFDIANFFGLAQLLRLGEMNLFRSFICDLYISVILRYALRRYMHCTEYSIKYQDEYDYPVSVLLHYYQLFLKNISRIIAQAYVVFPESAKSWSFYAKISCFFDILLCTVCMKWYNIVKF